MGISSEEFDSYIPVYDVVPEKWDDARAFFTEHLKKISNAINVREIGWFLDDELLSGKQFIPSLNSSAGASASGNFRSVLRKVIDCGTLPNTGTKTVPHGISIDGNFTLIQLYGSSTDPIGLLSFGLGNAAAAPNQVQLFLTATDIILVTGSDRTNFTRTYVVIEYLKEI